MGLFVGLSIGFISGVLWVILGNMGVFNWLVRGCFRSFRRVLGGYWGFL